MKQLPGAQVATHSHVFHLLAAPLDATSPLIDDDVGVTFSSSWGGPSAACGRTHATRSQVASRGTAVLGDVAA